MLRASKPLSSYLRNMVFQPGLSGGIYPVCVMSRRSPNTNNALEGIFTDLKTKLRVHSGIRRDFRKKIIDEYIKRHY